MTKLAQETMAYMEGETFEEATFVEARQVLMKEFAIDIMSNVTFGGVLLICFLLL